MEFVQKISDFYTGAFSDIDFNAKSFQVSIFFIVFNPLYWNFGARLEYNTKLLSKLAFGSKKLAVYVFSLTVFTLGIIRDDLYRLAILDQKTSPVLDTPLFKGLGILSFAVGSVFVYSSMYKLGIVGTYLGDHFGFLKKERITDFPFSAVDNPMYDGSSLAFLGTALFYGKPAGIFASALVYAMYRVVELIEEPFTAKIYAKNAEKEE
ncbi:DEKNAAC105475 [Brettanomyces naardenensis]|uniref:Phosphatidyl-N-methylethanolamine N-methyltransferase n=1 Tax=Brettanomyces naardenensis TaxID=13370 RepID=A0A448YTG1_BRENA|nr:DEKNAAC105475 [Brettanomyces naardenensis]